MGLCLLSSRDGQQRAAPILTLHVHTGLLFSMGWKAEQGLIAQRCQWNQSLQPQCHTPLAWSPLPGKGWDLTY